LEVVFLHILPFPLVFLSFFFFFLPLGQRAKERERDRKEEGKVDFRKREDSFLVVQKRIFLSWRRNGQ